MKKPEGPGQGPYIAKAKPRPKSGEQVVPMERWSEEAWRERGSIEAVLRLSEEEKKLIEDVSFLLEQNTLKADQHALDLIEERGFSAGDRYNELHAEEDPEKKHTFSETSPRLINPFAYKVLEWLKHNGILTDNPDEKAIIQELGSGHGNDALFLARNSKAHVIGVDRAPVGIDAAKENLKNVGREEYLEWIETSLEQIASEHGQPFGKTRAYLHQLVLQGKCTAEVIRKEMKIGNKSYKEEIARCIGRMNSARADFDTDDYRDTLQSFERARLQVVYSHSTLHYILPHILKEEISPMIADALRDEHGNPTGVFCVAMKLATSASALSPRQIKLAKDHPYNPSYDTVDELVRIYPKDEEAVIALFPDFDVEFCEVVDNDDYDKKGDTERMCHLILRPKVARAA